MASDAKASDAKAGDTTARDGKASDTKLGYQPGLDGVRAMAVIAVIAAHSKIPGTGGGGFGVDIFFALSGFLITSLLVEEWQPRHRISFPNFYARRALRLLPALVAVVAVFGTIAAFTHGFEARRTVAGIAPSLLYITNWLSAFGHYFGGLEHTWSLAIEEQFYLLWPPILFLLLRRGWPAARLAKLLAITAAVLIASRLVAMALGASAAALYNAFPFRADALALGALAAFLPRPTLRRVASYRHAIGALAVIAVMGLFPIIRVRTAIGTSLVAAATCVVIAHVLYGGETWLNTVFHNRAAVWTGRRSYGLYLWHWPIILFMQAETHLVRYPLAVAISFAAAAISARWIEFPFLRMKRRFGRTDAPAAVPL